MSRMVEAAGVEPASENTSSSDTTCVSPFSCRDRFGTEPNAPAAISEFSRRHATEPHVTTSLLYDGHPRAAGVHGATAHWLLSSESVVRIRSCEFSNGLTRSWPSARVPRSHTPVEAKSPPGGPPADALERKRM